MNSFWKQIAMLFLIGGCTTVAVKPVTVTSTPTQVDETSMQIDISPPQIQIAGDELIMTGTVTRKVHYDGEVPGRLDVQIVSSDGQLLEELPLAWRPRDIPIDGARQSTYSVHYGGKLPAGATVRVEHATDALIDPGSGGGTPAPSGGSGSPTAGGGNSFFTRTPGQPSQPSQPRQPGTPRTPTNNPTFRRK